MSGSIAHSHVIRIHAAWDRLEFDKDSQVLTSTRIKLPDTLPISPLTCHLVYQRKFNRPSGLSDVDRVELECELLLAANSIVFNGEPITSRDGCKIEISGHLLPHNEIKINVPVTSWETVNQATARLLIYAAVRCPALGTDLPLS